jgi:adenosylcobinamide-GDP ribazoletransferase
LREQVFLVRLNRSWEALISNLIIALRFLTVIPLRGTKEYGAEGMAGSLNYYAFVGLVLGSTLAFCAWGIGKFGLGLSGDVLIVALLALLTGGLHLDGLADTADGVFNCRTREQKLEIMRDSRIGAMGAVALILVLMLKVALTGELAAGEKLKYLFLMPALGRGAMVWSTVYFPYARKAGGMGSFTLGAGPRVLIPNIIILLLAGLMLLGVTWVAILLAVFGFVHVLGLLLSRQLGGLTGDTYGAICELAETFTLFLGVILNG